MNEKERKEDDRREGKGRGEANNEDDVKEDEREGEMRVRPPS